MNPKNYNNLCTLFLRVVVVFVFLWHGIPKAFNPGMAMSKFSSMGFPGFLGPIVGIVEVVAAVLILIGLWHKWANLSMAVVILVAVVAVQLGNGVTAGLERDLLLLAANLVLAAYGPGEYALRRDIK